MSNNTATASKNSMFDKIEETLIASLLGIMTLVTFANVVARKFFNSNILWALELTVYLFAWMVLLGAAYLVKKNGHLGVDVIINVLSPKWRRILALVSVLISAVFAFLLLKGAWDYWANYANFPGTDGRWFPLGFEDSYREKGWYEVNDIPMPWVLSWMSDVFNEGEAYEKIPRLIPYAVLPLSMALLFYRLMVVAWQIWQGTLDRMVASHEAEEELSAYKAEENSTQAGQV